MDGISSARWVILARCGVRCCPRTCHCLSPMSSHTPRGRSSAVGFLISRCAESVAQGTEAKLMAYVLAVVVGTTGRTIVNSPKHLPYLMALADNYATANGRMYYS